MVRTSLEIQAWIRADNMMGTWLANLVLPRIQASIIYKYTALEIWNDIKQRFSLGNGAQIFNLQKEIAKDSQGEDSITDFYTHLKEL